MKKLKQIHSSSPFKKMKPKSPVYNLLKIDVRETTINEVMPTHLYFYVDSRFTPTQLFRLRLTLIRPSSIGRIIMNKWMPKEFHIMQIT